MLTDASERHLAVVDVLVHGSDDVLARRVHDASLQLLGRYAPPVAQHLPGDGTEPTEEVSVRCNSEKGG